MSCDVLDTSAAASWVLVDRVQAGDREAFGLIYDRYFAQVFRFVYFRSGNRQLAEDLTADTFVRAMKNIGAVTYQGRDLGAWLMTIARNLVADHFKSGRYRLEIVTGDVLDADRPDDGRLASPEQSALARLDRADLVEAMKRLRPSFRQVLTLRFFEQMSVLETARALGINEGAAKALQWRATRALREQVTAQSTKKGRPVSEESKCGHCGHPRQQHGRYGCMGESGGCDCQLTQTDIQLAGDVYAAQPTARTSDLPLEPSLPAVEVRVEPRPNGSRSPVEAVLARASEAGGRLGKRAERIRELVTELDRDLSATREVLDAERRVRELAAQLDAAKSKLREVKGAPSRPATGPASVPPGGDPSPKVVRAWAAANGVECGPIGRVPRPVVAAYLAANGGGDA